ncbi:MAG: ABC transporter permease [Bacillota bacterium]|nr:ABC transporter permease [Bacillota bacterium]
MWEQIVNIFPLAIAYTAPLLIIALGGLYSERSGVVNIGLEGLMGVGAFATALFISSFEKTALGPHVVWISLLVSAAAGMLLSYLHAFASVSMKADQVISGTAINMLSLAITVYLARGITGSSNVQINRFLVKSDVPVLSNIPIIGPLFFGQAYWTTYVILAILVLSWFLLYKTKFGLRLRACGENPHAADSMGVSVKKMRYLGVLISGALAGLGGGIVIITYAKEFSLTTYNGLGFLALATLIFGKWKPLGILGAALFFGTATTISNIAAIFPAVRDLPNIILNSFPYVMTLVALVIFSNQSNGPKAAGEPYDVSKR